MLDFRDISFCLLIAFLAFHSFRPFFFTSHGLHTAPPMDLQEYIFSVINLIYRGCIRCIAMKSFAYKHECCITPTVSVLPTTPGFIPYIRKRAVL